MFGKVDSKQQISVEKLKIKIQESLDQQTEESTRKLIEVNTNINDLSQTIETAKNKIYEAELRLQQAQNNTKPDKTTLDVISSSIHEIQTLKQTVVGWVTKLETLQKERDYLLHSVKQEVERIFDTVRAELQKKVDDEAATLLTFLVSTENALEECRHVDCYIPHLKGISDIVPSSPYISHCRPKELVRYLHKTSPWWVCN